jgi:FdhD protein
MSEEPPQSTVKVARRLVARGHGEDGTRTVPQETAIAFTYGRATYAVMMATPADLEDFAIGFSLSEGIVARADEIAELEIVRQPLGIELRMVLAGNRSEALEARRRNMAGPAGCGLCGIESLSAAVRTPPRVEAGLRIRHATVFRAMSDLGAAQPLNALTRAVHGAGFWSMDQNRLLAVREDVGRHNALDKLIGALERAGEGTARGFIVLTSRISIELVQKAAAAGVPMLVAVSAPTAYAIRAADEAGLTLAAVARDDSFEIFTHAERIEMA